MLKAQLQSVEFETIYYQRKKESFVLHQFLKNTDFDKEVEAIPKKLKDIFIDSLCSYTMVPKELSVILDGLPILERLTVLIKKKYIITDTPDFDPNNLKEFFIRREKRLKEMIVNLWKI